MFEELLLLFRPGVSWKDQWGFRWNESKLWIGWFFISFGFEFLAFFLCMEQVGINATAGSALTLFSIVHLLARIPLLPQGLIVVEAVGLPFAYKLFPHEERTMLFFACWALVRFLSPLLAGGVSAYVASRQTLFSFLPRSIKCPISGNAIVCFYADDRPFPNS